MIKPKTLIGITNASIAFKDMYKSVELVAILRESKENILLFSSKYLDPMSPFESTCKVISFFRKYDKHVLDDISSVIVIHTEDSNIKNNKFNDMKNVIVLKL